MARKAQFRVWESKMKKGRFYRETLFGTRTGAKPPDQHFTTLAAAFKAVTEEWIAYAKALGVYGKHTTTTFLATHPVPYAPGSLQPIVTKLKLTPRARKAVKVIKREAAIEKIVEGAKIGQKRSMDKAIREVNTVLAKSLAKTSQAYHAPPSKGRMVLKSEAKRLAALPRAKSGKKFARRIDDARAKIVALA